MFVGHDDILRQSLSAARIDCFLLPSTCVLLLWTPLTVFYQPTRSASSWLPHCSFSFTRWHRQPPATLAARRSWLAPPSAVALPMILAFPCNRRHQSRSRRTRTSRLHAHGKGSTAGAQGNAQPTSQDNHRCSPQHALCKADPRVDLSSHKTVPCTLFFWYVKGRATFGTKRLVAANRADEKDASCYMTRTATCGTFGGNQSVPLYKNSNCDDTVIVLPLSPGLPSISQQTP